MQPISCARHRFPPEIIRHTIWLYLRFTLSLRDVEELLAERGLEVSYETVRRWVRKFGAMYARNLRRLRPKPSNTWHLDEMVVSIAGRRMYLWRAVDSEGEVLDMLVQPRRNKAAALKLMRKLLKKQGYAPQVLVTDKLKSYAAAKRDLGLRARHHQGLRANNRAENSHQPVRRRERKMQRSSRPVQLSASFPAILPFTTPSIFSAISFPVARCACSEQMPQMHGKSRPKQRETAAWRNRSLRSGGYRDIAPRSYPSPQEWHALATLYRRVRSDQKGLG